MIKLIPMTDFVLQRAEKSILPLTVQETFKDGAKITNEIFSYAYFLNKRLELNMFVPCDKDGNILEKPKKYNNWINYNYSGTDIGFEDEKLCRQYQKAELKVLFKGFNFKGEINDVFVLKNCDFNLLFSIKSKFFINHMRIECLVFRDLILSKTAKKQLGL